MPEEALEFGGGGNIVDVILVDTRAWDIAKVEMVQAGQRIEPLHIAGMAIAAEMNPPEIDALIFHRMMQISK